MYKVGGVGARFKIRIARLLEGGLFKFWEDLFVNPLSKEGIGSQGGSKFFQQELSSNILTIFVFIGIGVSICALALIGELVFKRWMRLKERLRDFMVRCRS